MWRCESDYPRGARLPGGENVISALHDGVQSVCEAISQNGENQVKKLDEPLAGLLPSTDSEAEVIGRG